MEETVILSEYEVQMRYSGVGWISRPDGVAKRSRDRWLSGEMMESLSGLPLLIGHCPRDENWHSYCAGNQVGTLSAGFEKNGELWTTATFYDLNVADAVRKALDCGELSTSPSVLFESGGVNEDGTLENRGLSLVPQGGWDDKWDYSPVSTLLSHLQLDKEAFMATKIEGGDVVISDDIMKAIQDKLANEPNTNWETIRDEFCIPDDSAQSLVAQFQQNLLTDAGENEMKIATDDAVGSEKQEEATGSEKEANKEASGDKEDGGMKEEMRKMRERMDALEKENAELKAKAPKELADDEACTLADMVERADAAACTAGMPRIRPLFSDTPLSYALRALNAFKGFSKRYEKADLSKFPSADLPYIADDIFGSVKEPATNTADKNKVRVLRNPDGTVRRIGSFRAVNASSLL